MRSRLLIPLIVLALSACGEVIPADEGSTTAATTATMPALAAAISAMSSGAVTSRSELPTE